MEFLAELRAWAASLDAPFAFLLALPFIVGALGLGALAFEARRRRTGRRDAEPLAFRHRAHRSAHGH